MFEANLFKMSNLNDNMDIKVDPGSMAPKSKAATQAFITDLMKNGLIPPEKGLRYLQMNETSRLYDELQADSKQAMRENYAMANVEDPTAIPFGAVSSTDIQSQPVDPMAMQGMAGNMQPMSDPYGMGNPNQSPTDPMAQMNPMGMQPQGPPPPQVFQPNSYDNDQVHVYEHELHMKSQEYEAYSPYIKSVFEQHLALTKQKVVAAQNVGLQQPGAPGANHSPIPTAGQPNGQVPVGAG
jgi:hypothetical protein